MKTYIPNVIAIDLDGVLSEGTYWGEGDPKPIKENIQKVNDLFSGNFIVIHTARRYEWSEETLNWLDRNGVKYHAISFEKVAATYYVDDRNMSLDELHKKLCKKQ